MALYFKDSNANNARASNLCWKLARRGIPVRRTILKPNGKVHSVIMYTSIMEAARELGVAYSTMNTWSEKKLVKRGSVWEQVKG